MISVNSLTVCYPCGKKAISDISFSIEDGEKVAVIGANGAGKSSLLLSLVGVLNPTAGTIDVNDIRLTKKTCVDVRKLVGLVFQNPDDQLFMNNAYDDIAFGPRNMGMSDESVGELVEGVLARLEIDDLRERSTDKLSGGEKRKVALATVLSMRPQVMLLDEPTTFLDPRGRRELIQTLAALNETLVLATHDLTMVKELCERVLLFERGELIFDGETKTALEDKLLLERCGLL